LAKGPGIDEQKVKEVPREEDQIAEGATSLEEELQIRGLKLDE
jgi:hypothetical protein